MLGKEVKTLVSNSSLKKGNHQIIWDGTNNFGGKVASGNYIAKLEFGNFAKSIKMTLLK
jgi:flagellar hook assembly protein FlgD